MKTDVPGVADWAGAAGNSNFICTAILNIHPDELY